jgi:hypothetical protein
MAGIVLTFPIVAGKVEAWRRFCQELASSRQQMYEASRQRLGITRERLVLVESAFGSAVVTTLEAPDVGWVLAQIIASDLPFDRWYREQLREFYGLDLAAYENYSQPVPRLPQNQQLLFEWTFFSSANSGFDGAG